MRPVRSRKETLLERLEDRLAMSVEPIFDFYASPQTPSASEYHYDPFATLAATVHQQTGVASARANYGLTGAGQTVVVIDTGIAWDHYALGRGLGANYRVVGGWDFAENDADPYDDGPAGFHGTHVAGIIGSSDSKYSGVATGVDLVGLRVFNDAGAGKFEWVEAALRWVHEHRNDFENPITTVNLSLGTAWNASTLPNWATLEEELKQLYDDGIFVSVAAGNDFAKYNTPGLSYPAVSPYVVAVGSVTSGGTFSSFSQRASNILAAPGQSITSTLPDWFMGGNGTPNDYGAASGTSMAAPYVAGAAVLVRQAMQSVGYVGINQTTIYQHLRNTADVFYDSATQANYFRINVGRAIDALMPADDYGGTWDTASQLGSLKDDATLSGKVGKIGDVDVFRFTAGVSGTINLGATSSFTSDIKLIGGTLETIDGKLGFRVTAGQEYAVQVGAKSGVGNYQVSLDVTATPPAVVAPPKTAWGQVTDNQINDVRVSGEAWYQISASRDGLLTIQSQLGAGGQVRVELLNAQQQVLAALDGAGRFDVNVSGNGTYFVRVTGNATDVDFRLTNLVSQVGASVTVNGTSGNDTFRYTAGASQLVSINGVNYAFGAQVTSVNFVGNGGNDTAVLTGTSRNETATFTPAQASLVGTGYRVTASGATNVTIDGNGGSDLLNLTGTTGNDSLTIASNITSFVGGGLNWRGLKFGTVNAASGGGVDDVVMQGTVGNDRFTASPTTATFSGSGILYNVSGFARVTANGNGGSDAAYLNDSLGNDQFTAVLGEASLTGAGFANIARGFTRVFATATQGNDTATLNDSAGNDLFYGRSNISWMTGNGFYHSAAGFDRVTATATRGQDYAYLYDTLGNDVFNASPTTATLRGTGYENNAAAFDRVFAYGSGGDDLASFTDSAGNDTFTSGSNVSSLAGNGFSNMATGFRRVSATATAGLDQAFFQELGQDDLVTGDASAASVTRAKLTELIVGFDFVTAKATTRGAVSNLHEIDYLFTKEGEW